ncbi:MAG: Ig-like domain-containing protein, partial [Bryobacteraceae bacterium]
QGAGYLFQLSGASSTGGNFYPYLETANPFNPVVENAVGPAGVSQVIAKPDGTKFYLLGTSGANALQSVNASFTTFTSINGLGALPTAAAITPDGKYLVVGADQLYIVDTSLDQVVSTIALPTTPVVAIAVSRNASTAYVVTNSSFGASSVTAYSMTLRQRITSPPTLNLPYGGANAIGISPLGLLYVTAPRRVYEINPATLTLTTGIDGIPVNAEPGPPHFSPDGTLVLFVNSSPSIGGASLLEISLPSLVATTWPTTFNPGSPSPVFNDIYIKDSGHAFAFSSASNSLYDVTTTPLNAVSSVLTPIFQTVGTPLAAAISTEVPEAGYLFLLAANGPQVSVDRISLATNTLNIQGAALLGSGTLQFVTVPAQSNPGTFIQYNNPQTGLAAGSTTLPLIARVLTASGVPVFNYPVTFSTDSTTTSLGLVINTPSAVTNADGYVQTTVTMPLTPGTYTVTLTAGVANVPFTLTIPGGTTCTSNCTTTGGSSQVTIVSGNGQLLPEGDEAQLPLTIQVTDTKGNPLPNIPVTYTVTSGLGNVNYTTGEVTDTNGMATAYFESQQIQQGLGFQSSTITASAATSTTNYGSVNFTMVTFHLDPTPGTVGTGIPQITVLSPTIDTGYTINISRGTPLTNAIVVQILSDDNEAVGTPIPGVGIQTQNIYNASLPPPAACQGSALSDSTGTANCTLVVSCSAPLGLSSVVVLEGGTFQIPTGGVTLNITGGSPATVQIPSTTLTGVAGQTLSLSAVVQDGCGSPLSGVAVAWTIVQGSASFKSTVTTTNSQGAVSAQVTLGQTPGLIQVRVTAAGVAQGTFSITNNQTIGALTLVSGGNQTAAVTQAFTTPLTFMVVDKSTPPNPVPGVVVSFSVTTGTATVNPLSATSNAQGQVTTSVTAGATAGAIVITASTTTGSSASASLTSIPASLPITSASFTNAASGAAGLVPCGLGTLIANGIASNVQGVVVGNPTGIGPLPYTLPPGVGSSGFSMTIDGVPVPLYSISNQNGVQQVNFQTPCEATVGSPATAVITINGGSTTVQGIQMLQAQPGIFTYAGPNGILYGAVISATTGQYVTPSTPAHVGQNYYLVATGLGQVTPPTATNSAGIAGQNVDVQAVVGVSNAGVPVLSTQYAVDQNGAYVVEFTIPPGSPIGPNQPLALAVIVNGASIFDNRQIYLAAVSN